MMQFVYFLGLFFLGAIFGSFISVVANRYNTGVSFFRGRSFCFSCGEKLSGLDIVPFFSFLFLKGKCRYCNSKISPSLFLTEIVLGILSIVAALKSGILNPFFFSFHFVIGYFILLFIFSVLMLITLYDLKHFIIPDSFLVVFAALSLLYNLYLLVIGPDPYYFVDICLFLITNILSGFIISLPFFILFLLSRGSWIGFGDIKYMLVIGFFLGITKGISAVILAFWIGAIFSLVAMFFKKILPHINLLIIKNNLTIKSEVPFGPFLSIGIIMSFWFNLDIFHLNEIFKLF